MYKLKKNIRIGVIVGLERERKLLKKFPDLIIGQGYGKNATQAAKKILSRKVDVILSGQETIGSAERSSDPEAMREGFHNISDGMYAKTIYNHFGTDRVNGELDEFLAHTFIPRSGGGIGMTRLIRSMKMEGLI